MSKISVYEKFSKLLQQKMKEGDITIRQAAGILGMNPAVLNDIRLGNPMPSDFDKELVDKIISNFEVILSAEEYEELQDEISEEQKRIARMPKSDMPKYIVCERPRKPSGDER